MTEASIREYREADVPAMAKLWQEVFGDPAELTDFFFALLPRLGTAVVAAEGEKLLGVTCVLDDLALAEKDGVKKAAYLYAVMTHPEARGRGFGAALCQAARTLALRRGCGVVCTSPASESLYGWYGRILDFAPALHCKRLCVPATASETPRALSAEEYRLLREDMLAGRPHLRLGKAAAEYEAFLCALDGGGLYAVSSGICAACREEGRCILHEVIAPESDAAAIAAAAAAHLGAPEAEVALPCPEGKAYLAAPAGSFPPDCVWNLIFG